MHVSLKDGAANGRRWQTVQSLSLRGLSLFGSMFNGFGGNKIDDVGMSFIRDMGGRFFPLM